MKKLICFILTLSIVLCFSRCGGDTSDTKPSENKGESQTSGNASAARGFSFSYNGTRISMKENFAPILKALGDPKSYDETPSCASSGMDKTYFYGSFYVTTYPDGDNDLVNCVWLVDDSVATDEGISIGDAKADVERAYGAESFNGTNAYIMVKDGTRLTVILQDDVVSSIQYDAIIG